MKTYHPKNQRKMSKTTLFSMALLMLMLSSSVFTVIDPYKYTFKANFPDVVVTPGNTVVQPIRKFVGGTNNFSVNGAKGVKLLEMFKQVDYISTSELDECSEMIYWQQTYVALCNHNSTWHVKLVKRGKKLSFKVVKKWPVSMQGMPYHGAYQGIPLSCQRLQINVHPWLKTTIKIGCTGQRGSDKYIVPVALIFKIWWWENNTMEIKTDYFPKKQIIPGT